MPESLGKKLSEIRKKAGLGSQRAAKESLGIGLNTLWNYENENTLPDVDFLARFATITGADLQELINLRLEAGGFSPLATGISDMQAAYLVGNQVDCAAHARQALLNSPDMPRPWCLAVMEMAARGEISPAGVDRLIGFVQDRIGEV